MAAGTNEKSHEALVRQAQSGKLVCPVIHQLVSARRVLGRGTVSGRASSNMRSLGIQNSYDCGHVLLEVLWAGSWTLIDVDVHAAFGNEGAAVRRSGPRGHSRRERMNWSGWRSQAPGHRLGC